MMDSKGIIEETAGYIAHEFAGEGSGHDWFHIDRVRRLAMFLGQQEGGDVFIIEMAALLHDLDDWKLAESQSQSPVKAKEWLIRMDVPNEIAAHILEVIEDVSYKGAGIQTPVRSVEAAIVQDADRLDAMGAIGIARTFAYGGHKKRVMYDPAIDPVMHDDFLAYKNSTAPTVNHFYEKLLLLKDRMNTKKAREMAEQRHQFMVNYLEQFFDEWKTVR